jgi:hypothetical protein
MSPYVWTWAARWGLWAALAVGWVALAAWRARRADREAAAVFVALAVAAALGLHSHLGPLLADAALPAEPTALHAMRAVALLGVAWLAARRPARADAVDLAAISPLAVAPLGWPAWILGIAVVGRGHTAPGQPRALLLAGFAAIGGALAVDHHRRSWVDATPLPLDDAIRAVSLLTASLEVAGMAALTAWAAGLSRAKVLD